MGGKVIPSGDPGPSDTMGGKAMSIQGPTGSVFHRLGGMTPEERAWRIKWLKDQELAPNEPKFVPELWREHRNPIRRFYMKPWDMIFERLQPILGSQTGNLRFVVPKVLMAVVAVYMVTYHLKYHQNDWTTSSGWRVLKTTQASLPGDYNYPVLPEKKEPNDYADRGFKARKVFLE